MRDPLPSLRTQQSDTKGGPPAPLQAEQVSRDHGNGLGVHDVSLTVATGRFVALVGPSGAGKTTLLRLLAGLDVPDRGRVLRDGKAAPRLQRGDTRVAVVFQRPRLVDRATALANVLTGRLGHLPRWRGLAGRYTDHDLLVALDALEQVGLLDRAQARADTLSGGEQQRVSIARALAQQPRVLLADEPVASLDPDNARNVLAILRDCAGRGLAVMASLHQPELAREFAHAELRLERGRIVSERRTGR